MRQQNSARPLRKRTWRCETCDYDLRGTWYPGMTACPECGTDIRYINRLRRTKQWTITVSLIWAPAVLMGLGAFGIPGILFPDTSTAFGMAFYVGLCIAPITGILAAIHVGRMSEFRNRRCAAVLYAVTAVGAAAVSVMNGLALYAFMLSLFVVP